MAEPTLVLASMDDDKLRQSIDSLVTHVKNKLGEMLTDTNNTVYAMQKKLQSLGDVEINSGGASDGGSSRRKKSQQEETDAVKKTTQAYAEQKTTLDQQAQAIKSGLGVNSTRLSEEQKISEEVRKQAAAIREMAQFKEKGYVMIGDKTYYDSESSVMNKKHRLSLEEQILRNLQEQQAEEQKTAQAQAQTAAEAERMAQAQKSVTGSVVMTNEQMEKTLELQRRNKGTLETNADTQKSVFISQIESANALSAKLKELKAQYQDMNFGQRRSKDGQAIAQQIREITRDAQILNRELNRPTKKEVFGLSEKTLDDLSYKMRQLNAYKMGLNLTDPKQLAEMRQVDASIERLKKQYDELMGKQSQLVRSNTALGRSWNYMKNRLAFYFTVGASTQFIRNLIEVRSQYEMNERALGILVNSAERGTQIFNELSQMALVSPYTLIELSAAAKQLTAYDIAAKDVVDTTRRLADMASAVGVPVERLTYALGQIKAYSYLNSRDLRMFANAGIPLAKQLSDYYTEIEGKIVSTGDVYDRVKKKAVSYNDVMQVVYRMTDEGGKFFDFQAKMADTLKVRLANLTLAWNNMLNDMGKSSQGVLTWGIGALKTLFEHWETFSSALTALLVKFAAAKVAQMAFTATVGKTVVALSEEYAATERLSAAEYRKRFETMQLTKAQAVYLVAQNRTNLSLQGAIYSMGLLSKRQIYIIRNFGMMGAAAVSAGSLILSTLKGIVSLVFSWQTILMATVAALFQMKQNADKVREMNESIINGAKEAAQTLDEFIKKNDAYRQSAGSMSPKDADKAWNQIREAIETSSSASKYFIGRLLEIEDVNERVKKGFEYAEQIRDAAKAMQDLGESAIAVSHDAAFGVLGEGLKSDLQDYIDTFKAGVSDAGEAADEAVRKADYTEFMKELDVTVQSIVNEFMRMSLTPEQMREAFTRVQNEIVNAEKLTAEQAHVFRLEIENAFVAAMRFKAARMFSTTDMRGYVDFMNEFNNVFVGNQAALEEFFAWVSNRYGSLFNGMTQEEIKNIDLTQDRYKEMWNAYYNDFFVNHNRAYNELKESVKDANTWKIMIPVYFSPAEAPSTILSEWEKADKDLKEAQENIDRLNKGIKKLESEGKKDTEEYTKAAEELTQAQKDLNDAKARGGLSKDKNGGNKKDPVLDAIKQEISLVEKLQSDYDKLTKAGMTQADALGTIHKAYDNTIKQLNDKLGAAGLPLLTSQLITGKDPHKALAHFNKTLLDLVSKGMLTLERSKEIEAVIEKLTISAKTYDLDKITKGLNNELEKLKDEYELAVALEADPELGSVFAEMFDIDTSTLPKNVEQYADEVLKLLNKYLKDTNTELQLPNLNLTKDDLRAFEERVVAGTLSESAYERIKKDYENIRELRKKNAEDTIKQSKELEYKLADTNGKIAIEEEKLARLKKKLDTETNERRKHLLQLQIKEQEGVIAKLREEVLQMLPTYKNLFNSIVEHSSIVTRQIANMWSDALKNATKNPDGTYTISDPISGQKATLSAKEYGKQIDKANGKLRETRNSFEKIKEAFTKGEDGIVDWAKGVEVVTEEIEKLGQLTDTIGSLFELFGNANEYNATAEVIKDISKSLSGVATAAKGIGQIASGDYIGGAAGVVSGVYSTVSTWLDNANNRINDSVKKSERSISRLELAYAELEHTVEKSYGTAVIGAQKLAIANKELQLSELKRQLTLERSRSAKNRDEDRIIGLQKEIRELEYSIQDATEEVVNNLLGISSVGDAMENLMDGFISALRSGEDAMDVFNSGVNDMIANMVKKMFTTKILQPWFEEQWAKIEQGISERSSGLSEKIKQLEESRQNLMNRDMASSYWYDLLGIDKKYLEGKNVVQGNEGVYSIRDLMDAIDAQLADLENELKVATIPTTDDIRKYAELLRSGQPIVEENMKEVQSFLEELGLMNDEKEKALSALQQGISGVTEETASAVEAYLNGMSQQGYLRNDILTQIRDTIQSFELDIQTATMGQILLQLQASYTVQMSIQSTLDGWTNANGQAVRVELIS